jgi:ABC-type lipoprotein export system ATPase subunit
VLSLSIAAHFLRKSPVQSILIVTHDRSVAQQTDRILEISDGALLQDVRNAYVAPRG